MTEPETHTPVGRTLHLSVSGVHVQIRPDDVMGGWVLEVDGMIQSHVDLEQPTRIQYEYLQRMAHLIDRVAPSGEPISILHLGAGALTLPRYVQATRPGSAQTVVELERELVSLVTEELPLPEGTQLRSLVGDARAEALALADAGERFDVVVLDIFTGEDTAAHLTGRHFYTELLGMLRSEGVLMINIGDDTGLTFYASQARELEAATERCQLNGAWTLADATMLERLRYGNAVLAAGELFTTEGYIETSSSHTTLQSQLIGAGPHPAAVLTPEETAALTDRIRTVKALSF